MAEISFEEARAAMIAKRFGGNAAGAATGGAGSARRKNKGVAKAVGDDKKVTTIVKKLGGQDIKGVETVNIFQNDGNVIHIRAPKILGAVPCNTFVITGHAENRKLEELLPGVLTELGPESMGYLREIAKSMGADPDALNAGDDEEVPELVENFEEAADN